MTRAELEAAAEEKWREYKESGAVKHHGRAKSHFIAAYIQGRLDQAEEQAGALARDITFLWDWRVNQGMPFISSPRDVEVMRGLLDGTPLEEMHGFEWVKQAREEEDE